ncbi:MAG TPA: histidine ammonia-lyase [Balneolaceae bacterium]|nr:histidine ammonia-lyase [Balneolaceae bacterium]|tara:strand:+ start:178236 stop:179804 length:1569 start_codon:yes stop_codon:yes gene_type:complete
MTPFLFGIDTLSVQDLIDICTGNRTVQFGDEARSKVRKSAGYVEAIVEEGEVVYGINTGFGPLCNTVISKDKTAQLQDNILRSHSVGVGKPIAPEIAKAMMVLKVHNLSMGFSGIQESTLDRIIFFIENDIIPVVPEQGSVGASGDLAPLAHLFLPLIGLGEVFFEGKRKETAEVYQRFGLEPIQLKAKEGLALINGTQFIAAHLAWGVYRAHHLLNTADIIGAMSLEGVLGSVSPFEEELHKIRPYDGTRFVARRMRELLKDSEMVQSHANCGRVQDPYSIRCMPQVHGSSRNAWLHVKQMVDVEINSVTDNPIILSENEAISGGNFHGQPLALPADYLTLAAHEVGNISDRRIYLLLEGGHPGLPKLLMDDIGLNSGFMIPQYTSAALVSENKALCFPASADSIPTSLGQEDHVSMGSISSRKLNQVISNLEQILAIELVSAAQAFDFRRPMRSGPVLEACHELIRSHIDHADADRVFAEDIGKAHELIKSYQLTQLADKTAIKFNIDLNGEFDELFRLS